MNVINLHLTDFCNYNCKYCFVRREANMLSLSQIKLIVDKIDKYFKLNNINNGRINLAGVAPLTYKYIQDVIDYINDKGIKVSIITNGSLLTDDFINYNKFKIASIGISVDSLNKDTNLMIGRCSKNLTIEEDKLVKICRSINKNNIDLKINIVVSKYNINEDFTSFLKEIKIDRFKLLQMTIEEGVNEIQEDMRVSDEEFKIFTNKLNNFNPIIETEDLIKDSYLIIDSSGFVSTSNNHQNIKEHSLLDYEFNDILKLVSVDVDKSNKRYI